MPKQLTSEQFIETAQEIHGNTYDYSKVNYKGCKTPVTIVCTIHGDFQQTPDSHKVSKICCPQCVLANRYHPKQKTTQQFIDESIEIHGDKYDYSKTEYTNNSTDVVIVCPNHGEFYQRPSKHLMGRGCQRCGGTDKKTTQQFIDEANIIHNNVYDYSLTKYTTNHKKIKILCKTHGVFTQTPAHHLKGCGCQKCADIICANKRRMSTQEYISKASLTHNNKYDYSKTVYTNWDDKITIKCIKHNYIFEQHAGSHLNGCGCPKCNASKGEIIIGEWLIKNNITHETEKRFKNCKHKRPLPFDFYIPSLNICIEYDGIQHFSPITYFGGEDNLNLINYKDTIKTNYCRDNGVKLLRIPYTDFDRIDKILEKHINY